MKSNQLRALGVLFLVAAIVVAVVLFNHVHRTQTMSSPRSGIGTPSGGTGPMTAPLHLPARPASEIHVEWRTSVQNLLAQYDQNHDAAILREALLRLTVTNEDRDQHLALVLALNGVIDHLPQAEETWNQTRQRFERAN